MSSSYFTVLRVLAKNYNVKIVISEVYAFLAPQCTVSGL